MFGTTQTIIDWARMFIPDPKTRTRHLDGKEIGKTALPTNQRETFYIPFNALGGVKLYVEPYMYASTASLSAASATDKVFQYNATLQSCIFPSGSDTSIRPAQFKSVLAHYYYTEDLPYTYTDRELLEYLPSAISHLNNGYNFSYTSTGTISTFLPVITTDDDKQLLALALAITVRTSYVHEQMRKGLGVSIRGPMQSIDTKSQLKEYNDQTKALTALLFDKSSRDRINDIGGSVDIYTENVVTA